MSGSLMSGGGVDAGIPLRAVASASNPLQSVGDFARTLGAINQTKLQQQALTSGAATVQQHLQQVGSNAMAPFLAIQNPTMTDLTNAAAYAEKIAGGTTQHIMQVAQNNPFPPNTPEWGGWMKRSIAALAQTDPATAVAQAAGTPVDQDNGLSINSGVRAPVTAGGGVTLSSSTPVYPPRVAQMGRTTGPPGPNGEATTVPIGAVTPPSLTGLPMGTGRMRDTLPPGLQNPNAPPMPGPIPGQITTGIGPAAQSQLATSGAQSAQKFQGVADEATQAKEQDAVLANMQNDLQNFTSGPGAHNEAALQKIVQGWIPPLNGAWKTKIAAQESFDKLANQLVTTASPGSDARQAVIQGATPNSAQSPEGVDFILRQLRGMTDYKIARANQAAAPGIDKSNYPSWQSASGNALNPQVFQFARLTPAQKATFLNGIPAGPQRNSFRQQYDTARAAGFYGVSNGGQ